MQQSFVLPANGEASPEMLERRRRIAEAMLAQGMDASPVGHWSQGAARMAQALIGGLTMRNADKREGEGRKAAREALAAALSPENTTMNPMQQDSGPMLDYLSSPYANQAGTAMVGKKYADMNPQPVDPVEAQKALLQNQLLEAQIRKTNAVDPAGADEYGLNPIITQDEKGKYHLFQASKAGKPPKEIPLPYGWTPKNQFLDTGLGYQGMPTQGVPTQPQIIPKDVAGEAAAKVKGKETGEAAALHSSLTSKLPGLMQTVEKLNSLADEATYTTTGQMYNLARKELGAEPTRGAVARAEYVAKVDNQVLPMLRDTFGAQFTVVEGETLRKTLGDPDKAPAEKKAVLNAFIEQKIRDIEAAAKQGGITTETSPTIPNQGGDEYKEGDVVQNSTGQRLILKGGEWVPYGQ